MPVPVKKGSFSIKCTSCNKLRPLASYPRHDMRMLQRNRHHIALCNSCRLVCRSCGQVILKSTATNKTMGAVDSASFSGEGGVKSYPKMSAMRGKMEREIALSSSANRSQSKSLQSRGHGKQQLSYGTDSGNDDDAASGSAEKGVICDTCAERASLASTNVFYRFPMLRFKQCPFGTEKYRRIISEEVRSSKK